MSIESRKYIRDLRLSEFDDEGIEYEPYRNGEILVMRKFVVALITKKWRILGRKKWYAGYSKATDFVEKFY